MHFDEGYCNSQSKRRCRQTTTAVNLSACLGNWENGSCLWILTLKKCDKWSRDSKQKLSQCIYNVLIEGIPIENVIQNTDYKNLQVVPARIELAGAEIELVNQCPEKQN